GIPIEVVPSPHDLAGIDEAYTIPKDRYYLPDLDLEPGELAALSIAGGAVLGASDEASSGLMKLSVDLSPGAAGGPRIAWGADLAAEQPLLTPVYGALLDRVPITFGYRRPDGTESERTIEPYALVHRRGNWYLVGRDTDREDVRSFRLSRFTTKVTRGKGGYDIPEGFDAAAHIGGHAFEIGADAPEEASVRFSPRLSWWVKQNWPDEVTTEQDDGSVVLRVPVANRDAFVSWVMGFGDDVEIIEPTAARQALLDHLAPYLGDAP
ncbi:MAG: helix-turn-helix transcriptional regulator, partial [Actinomycetota bacterium]